MKKILYMTLAAVAVMACQQKEPEFLTTDKGPQQTINCDAAALMGSDFNFSVDLQDPIALSTLKVQLKFDDTVVADTTIRTKTNGSYSGRLLVPFYKDIPDGVATAVFTSQNIQFGITSEEKEVRVSRPDFEYLTLKPVTGGEFRMEKTGEFTYAVTGDFDASVDAFIETAPYDAAGRKLAFGYGATGVELNGTTPIPFSNGVAGNYEISFNTQTWEAAPFVTLTVNGVEAVMIDKQNYAAVVSLHKGDAITIEGYEPGFADFTLDPDWFTEDFKFNAVDGLYKVTIQMGSKFFLVEKMVSADTYATLDNGNAVWLIGENYGKPAMFSASWNTNYGLCLAEVEPGIHQITFVAGDQIKTGSLNVKLFHQKGWGGEFGGGSYAAVESDLVYAGESDGNIHLLEGVSLDLGGIYRLTLDLTGGVSAAVLKFAKVGQNEIETDDITFAGKTMDMVSATAYSATVSLTQGQAIEVKGIADLASWTLDPDFFTEDFKFVPVSGFYKVTAQMDKKFFLVERLNEDGSYATLGGDGTGAVWMIGDTCFGKPEIFTAGWNTDLGLCMAEVSPKVFQITFVAGTQLTASSINVKLFHQKGWGGEFGGGAYASVESDLLTVGESDGNIHLAKTLEVGAPYRFTLDLTGGVSAAVLKFEKAGDSSIVSDKISVNGVKLALVGADEYAGTVTLKKGDALAVTGVDDIASWWIDPDFVTAGAWNAVDGDYVVTLDKANKVAKAYRVKADGSRPNLAEGGLYIQGWGVASVRMTGQVGWPGAGAYQMAQVSPGVFQMTGKAVAETDDTVGGRWRTDYWSVKYFFQDGWGGEASKEVEIAGNAADCLTQGGDGNLGLAKNLEEGATYRLTVDFSDCTLDGASIASGKEKVTFEKL